MKFKVTEIATGKVVDCTLEAIIFIPDTGQFYQHNKNVTDIYKIEVCN